MNKSYVRLGAALLSILGLVTSQTSFAQCENPVGLDDVMAGLEIGFSVDPSEQQPDFVLAAQGVPTRGFISPEARYYTGEDVVTVQYETDYFLTYLWLGAGPFNAPTPEERILKLENFRAQHSDIGLLIDGVPIGAPIETMPQDGFNPWDPGSPMAYMFFYWISEPYTLTLGFHGVRLEYRIDGAPQSSTANLEVLEDPRAPGANVISNGSFEASDISGWLNLFGSASVGAPAAGAQDGIYAAALTPEFPGTGASIIVQNFPACPGDELYASGYMLTETPLVDSPARRIIKLSYYDVAFDPFRLIELAPAAISKGVGGADPFPGIEGLPLLDTSSALNTWQLTQSQGVAPAGTKLASVLLLNTNDTGSAAPIWFDNIVVARLVPDMDSDGIANDIDTDPLTATADFSDGTTSGTITDPGNQTLAISDEPHPDGIRITAASGGFGAAATVSVCDGTANLTFTAGDESVVTCGSVQVIVIVGEVEMEVEVNGETAIVSVPADYVLTYEPVTATFSAPETNPDTVIVIVGGAEVPVAPGKTVVNVEIDIKPGSDPNCFNKNGHGVIPVAILGSDTFDVPYINQDSLSFGGLAVRVKGNNRRSCGLEDTNADGFDDLVCHFDDDASTWIAGGSTATLTGELDSTSFIGKDSICIVP